MRYATASRIYFINALVLSSLLLLFVTLWHGAHYPLKVFMMVVILYMSTANIVAFIMRYYGVRYTPYKPKIFIFDSKTYFRTSLPNRTRYNKYYAYRCWDFADCRVYNDPINNPNQEFNRYYRTENGPLEKVGSTTRKSHAIWINLLNFIGCVYTIFIYKE